MGEQPGIIGDAGSVPLDPRRIRPGGSAAAPAVAAASRAAAWLATGDAGSMSVMVCRWDGGGRQAKQAVDAVQAGQLRQLRRHAA